MTMNRVKSLSCLASSLTRASIRQLPKLQANLRALVSSSSPLPIAPSLRPSIRSFSSTRGLWHSDSNPPRATIPQDDEAPPQGRLAMIYTCKTCNQRHVKTFSKVAYQRGVVIVRCPGCDSLHLVADHLGYFDDNSQTIESILKQKNELVQRRLAEKGDIELIQTLAGTEVVKEK